MKYTFKPVVEQRYNDDGDFVEYNTGFYTMYEVTSEKTKKIKKILPKTTTPKEIRAALICHLISEGSTLEELTKSPWSPTKVEFFIWIEGNPEFRAWYDNACKYRALILVDTLYKKIFTELKGSSEIGDITKLLREIIRHFNQNREEEGKSNVALYSKIVVPDYFKRIKSDERKG